MTKHEEPDDIGENIIHQLEPDVQNVTRIGRRGTTISVIDVKDHLVVVQETHTGTPSLTVEVYGLVDDDGQQHLIAALYNPRTSALVVDIIIELVGGL